jgi:hypothetical protein
VRPVRATPSSGPGPIAVAIRCTGSSVRATHAPVWPALAPSGSGRSSSAAPARTAPRRRTLDGRGDGQPDPAHLPRPWPSPAGRTRAGSRPGTGPARGTIVGMTARPPRDAPSRPSAPQPLSRPAPLSAGGRASRTAFPAPVSGRKQAAAPATGLPGGGPGTRAARLDRLRHGGRPPCGSASENQRPHACAPGRVTHSSPGVVSPRWWACNVPASARPEGLRTPPQRFRTCVI